MLNSNAFGALLIPHTLAVTASIERKAGDRVNIEVDHMARYAARLTEAGRGVA
jgi:riboflavin synthase